MTNFIRYYFVIISIVFSILSTLTDNKITNSVDIILSFISISAFLIIEVIIRTLNINIYIKKENNDKI